MDGLREISEGRTWNGSADDTAARQRVLAVVGLIVAFGWTFLLVGRSRALTNIHNDIVTIAAEWAVALVLGIITFGVQKRGIGEFGLGWLGWRDTLAMLGALVAAYVSTGVVLRFIPMQTSSLDIRDLAAVPFPVKLSLIVTAAICEEFMYRGFGIEELADLTGSVWLGGVISWLAFSLAHVDRYGLTTALLIPAIVGAFLTLLYLWRRNLPVCMLMHAIVDGIAFFLLPMLMTGHAK